MWAKTKINKYLDRFVFYEILKIFPEWTPYKSWLTDACQENF